MRFAEKYNVEYDIFIRTVIGGTGAVKSELTKYARELALLKGQFYDVIIIVKDANCQRWQDIKRWITSKFKQINTIFAIPEPHIEKWYLIDPSAIKKIIGHGYTTPSGKCDRDYYKQELFKAIRQAGIIPPLGGIEYANDIVDYINIDKMDWGDRSFLSFMSEMHRVFKSLTS